MNSFLMSPQYQSRWPIMHRLLIAWGAMQSIVAGIMLMLKPSLIINTLLVPSAALVFEIKEVGLSQEVHTLLFSTIGALLIFYGFVMSALVVRFDIKSLRIKGAGEILSGLLFAWISWSYAALLEPWLGLLAVQHLLVGFTYFATTTSRAFLNLKELRAFQE